MRTIVFTKKFEKMLKKLPKKDKDRAVKALANFAGGTSDSVLRVHSLHGKYKGAYSIDITGDLRAIYKMKHGTYFFVKLGNHNQLYS